MTAPTTREPGRMASIEAMGFTGIVFAVLTLIGVEMLRGMPGWSADHAAVEQWFAQSGNRTRLTSVVLIMVVASIALLWFIGTLRRRLGQREDQLFATVFLGSGVILIGLLLTSVAAFAVPATIAQQLSPAAAADAYPASHGLGMVLITIIAPRISAVFMLSLANLARVTRAFPRWLTLLSTAAALFMLIAVTTEIRIAWVLPAWSLVIGIYIVTQRKHLAPE
ncbi:hypothetical protein KHQ06_37515 [Nocardia tengchongensis]|uniref:DUF4386 family protein n=1 Tax=Nocardia tengchongensis TaxID=2055889 RepID=A0ABX8CSP9_9NOCA|nr:hypothetical protein [Nocardia tengchongensis]QVI21555.1 hypothetical protein KHQ06_37515 [Nocardia tengchongensis]